MASLQEQTAAADFFQRPFEQTEPVLKALADTQAQLDEVTERWIELDEQAPDSGRQQMLIHLDNTSMLATQ